MTPHAERIRHLRERAGKTVEEMATALEMTPMEYFDLELHDSELPSVPSLAAVRELAALLGVTVPALLSEDAPQVSLRLTHEELVERVKVI